MDMVEVIVENEFKKLSKFNYYMEAKIVKKNADETFNIELNEDILPSIKARSGIVLNVGDIVLVCIVNANYSNMFIDLKRP